MFGCEHIDLGVIQVQSVELTKHVFFIAAVILFFFFSKHVFLNCPRYICTL